MTCRLGHARCVTLGLLALFLFIGVPAGFLAGLGGRPLGLRLDGDRADRISLPAFMIGAVLIIFLVFEWQALPVGGWGTVNGFVLPAITLSAPFAAVIARLSRAGVLEIVHEDYVRTAKAKGLPRGEIVLKHMIRGAILPVVPISAPRRRRSSPAASSSRSSSGSPGWGCISSNSAINRDFSLILGVVIVYSTFLVCFNLVVDIAYGFLDPRVRLGK